jgi:hypothetical protein
MQEEDPWSLLEHAEAADMSERFRSYPRFLVILASRERHEQMALIHKAAPIFGLDKRQLRSDLLAVTAMPRPDTVLEADEAGHLVERPTIDAADEHLPRVTAAAWDALLAANNPPHLFRHGGHAVRIERADDGVPVLVPLNQDRMRYELARCAVWQRMVNGRPEMTKPPLDVVRDVLARPNPPLAVLAQVVSVPVFGPDGEWQTEPGYQAASRTFHAPARECHIPAVAEQPSAAEVARARALLLDDVLGDFPFVGEAERAHALAAIVLPFVRPMIAGPTPLHLIEKPSPGTGGSLLAEMPVRIATGRAPAVMSEGRDEDEWRKRITAKLATGPAVIVIDNIRRPLESAALASALTADVFEDRRLGHTQVLRLPVRGVWIATGNNPALSEEIARRTVRIRLDANVERPWMRTGFRHEDLKAWVSEHHDDLIWAVAALVRAWLAAGRPGGTQRLGMYEQWADTIGGILTVAGVPGFLGNLEDFYAETDAQGSALRALVNVWWSTYQSRDLNSSSVWHLIQTAGIPLDVGAGNERSQTTRVGLLLAQLRDRQIDGYRVERRSSLHGVQRWRLVCLKEASGAGAE